MRIMFRLPDRPALDALVGSRRLDIGGGGPKSQPDGTMTMEAYVPKRSLAGLKREGWKFDIIEDATEVGRQRQLEVGKGDRFNGGARVPRGFGQKE